MSVSVKMSRLLSEAAKLNGAKQFKAKSEEIANELADERYGSAEYKRILAKARKALAPLVDGEEEVDYVIQKAEKFADALRDDRAAGQSLSRMAPLGDYSEALSMRQVSQYLESIVIAMDERAAFPVGTTRTWKRGEYTKTADGWRRVGGGTRASSTGSTGKKASSTSAVSAFVAKAARDFDTSSYTASEIKRRLDGGDEESAVMQAQNDLEYQYARKHWGVMNKQAKEVESDLKGILGDNPKVQGFIGNVTGTFSQKHSGWQRLSDTERRMNDISKAADALPNDTKSLATAGVSAEQAQKVSALLKSHVAKVMGRIKAAEAAAEKGAKKIVAKMKANVG